MNSNVVGCGQQYEQPSRYQKCKEKTRDDRNGVMPTTCRLAICRRSSGFLRRSDTRPEAKHWIPRRLICVFYRRLVLRPYLIKSKAEVMVPLSCSRTVRSAGNAWSRPTVALSLSVLNGRGHCYPGRGQPTTFFARDVARPPRFEPRKWTTAAACLK